MQRRAFSLIELSIVLVILGLLTGGILAGKSLIRASELRSVTTDQQRYVTATHGFRDRYFALPGDMNNATAVWGKDATNCNSDTGTAATNGVCNGDSNGFIGTYGGGSAGYREMFQYWKQLAAAGLIEGTYTGIRGAAGNADTVAGENAPPSKLNSALWGIQDYASDFAGSGSVYAMPLKNALILGAYSSNSVPDSYALRPEEAWNIDTKMDDGQPGYGKVIGRFWNNQCSIPIGTAANTNYNGTYNLAYSNLRCALYFRDFF